MPGEPKTIGRYEVKRVLGHGAMGLVYLAFDPLLKRPLAIKTVREFGPDAESTLARFQPDLLRHPGWYREAICAEAWLIKGDWELSHGQPANASLAQAKTLADTALQANPQAGAIQALQGLVRLLELKLNPSQAPALRRLAQERLRLAQKLSGSSELCRRLEVGLHAYPGGR